MKSIAFLTLSVAPHWCKSFQGAVPISQNGCAAATPQQLNNFLKNPNFKSSRCYSHRNLFTPLNFTENSHQSLQSFSNSFCKFAPLLTIIAAVAGVKKSSFVAPTFGSLPVMQKSLSILMLAMGLTITPQDFREAANKPSIVFLNAFLCFGMMPLLAMGISSVLKYNPVQTAGIVLLGSVSGGQASNLFTLLAGGDVALSVVCTVSTTLLGVLATPLLIKHFLNAVVDVEFISVLQSVANLVLLPLMTGLVAGKFAPRFVKGIGPFCPVAGVLLTMILVAGSAANSAFFLGMDKVSIIGSCLLPILGCILSLLISRLRKDAMNETSRRALVIETLSKSPTLAYVLARKHFGLSAATIPAAGMISLAVIGALVASIWSMVDPIER